MRQWSVSWGLVASTHTQTCLPLPLHLPLVSGSLSWGGSRWGMVKVKVAQSCPTLCKPMDFTVHGILQARILEWVAFSVSGDLPNPEVELRSPELQVDSQPAEPQGKPVGV